MASHLVLLRAVNVGGRNLVSMRELTVALEEAVLADVHTFLQSGNVVFTSRLSVTGLRVLVEDILCHSFQVATDAVVFTSDHWTAVLADAPSAWGSNEGWRYNLLVAVPPSTAPQVARDFGPVTSSEMLTPGDGVLYQGVDAEVPSAVTFKMSGPRVRHLVVRSRITAHRLLGVLDA